MSNVIGERSRIRDSFLQDGDVPLGFYLTKGLSSLVNDPVLMIVRYMPGLMGFKLRQIYYRRRLGKMGKGILFDPDVSINVPRHVFLDDFCYIGKGAQLYAPEGYIRIGKRSHISATVLGHGGVEIGAGVASGGLILSVTDSHYGGARMGGPMIPSEQRNLRYGKVVIGDDAFLGRNSMVMPGVTIGEGAVVGPYSLVVKDVPPWTVVMGCPAVEIDKRPKVRFPEL
jgi:acetyltransferase-like isoleucine patch superfamily enzyme